MKKIKLDTIKVESFLTKLGKSNSYTIQGGTFEIELKAEKKSEKATCFTCHTDCGSPFC